jgi:hypothetical protein
MPGGSPSKSFSVGASYAVAEVLNAIATQNDELSQAEPNPRCQTQIYLETEIIRYEFQSVYRSALGILRLSLISLI